MDYVTCGTGSYFDFTSIMPTCSLRGQARRAVRRGAEAGREARPGAGGEPHPHAGQRRLRHRRRATPTWSRIVRGQIADPHLGQQGEDGPAGGHPPVPLLQPDVLGPALSRLLDLLPHQSLGGPRIRMGRRPLHAEPSGPKRVLVVGGGPAGLEAARVAAERGHQVTLAEASDRARRPVPPRRPAAAPRADPRSDPLVGGPSSPGIEVEVRLNSLIEPEDVDEAGDPVVAGAPAPAHLVAGDARPDVLRPAGPRLVHEVRIGDLAAHDGRPCRPGRRPALLSILRRADVALGCTRACRTTCFSAAARSRRGFSGVERRRHELVEVEVAARAAGHVIHEPALVMPGDDLLHRLARQRHLDRRVDVTARPTMKSSPRALRMRSRISAENRMRFSKLPPHLSVAPVRPGRPELVHHGVVGGEQLDPVEAGFAARAARPRRSRRSSPRSRPRSSRGCRRNRGTTAGQKATSWARRSCRRRRAGRRGTAAGSSPRRARGRPPSPGGNAESRRRRKGGSCPASAPRWRCTGIGSTTIIAAPPRARSA